jgi:hypothetical protein
MWRFAGMTALALAGVVLIATEAMAVQFLPHRATYELKAKNGGGFGQASGALGILSYELADGCDGWTVNQKAGIRLIGTEGEEGAFDWSQSTWEAKDGGGLRYSIREARDGELLNQRRGEVTFPSRDGPGKLVTELPERKESEIESAMLPMAHSTAIMERPEEELRSSSRPCSTRRSRTIRSRSAR